MYRVFGSYMLYIALLLLTLMACNDQPGNESAAHQPDTTNADQPPKAREPTTANHKALRLLADVMVPLPKQRIVTSTSRDTELDEYLFTPLTPAEQTALNIDAVFGGDPHLYTKLPAPEVFAVGKLAESKGGYLVLFCAVYNVDLHLYRLHAATYDRNGTLTDQAFLGQMDFITPGLAGRKYWLIFSKETIEFAKGRANRRHISAPCTVVRPSHGGLHQSEETCSRHR